MRHISTQTIFSHRQPLYSVLWTLPIQLDEIATAYLPWLLSCFYLFKTVCFYEMQQHKNRRKSSMDASRLQLPSDNGSLNLIFSSIQSYLLDLPISEMTTIL